MQTCIVMYRKKSHFFWRFFAKLHFQTQGGLWLCAVSWVNRPSSFLGRGGLKSCSWATSCHHVTNAGYIKPSCLFLVFGFIFCIFKGYDKQLYSVFHRHQSRHKESVCFSLSSTVPVAFVSSSAPLLYATVLYTSQDTDLNVHCQFICDVFALMLVPLNNCHFFFLVLSFAIIIIVVIILPLNSNCHLVKLNTHTHWTMNHCVIFLFYFVQCPISCWWKL